MARNLNIHHQSVNDKEGLPHTVFGSVREFTNQPNVHGLTGLSLRAGSRGNPRLLREWPPATFIGK